MRIGKDFHRPVQNREKARLGDVVAFVDGYPFPAISESSLADLNDRLVMRGEEAVPMNRFRPNLVISGSSAWRRYLATFSNWFAHVSRGRRVRTMRDHHHRPSNGRARTRTFAHARFLSALTDGQRLDSFQSELHP